MVRGTTSLGIAMELEGAGFLEDRADFRNVFPPSVAGIPQGPRNIPPSPLPHLLAYRPTALQHPTPPGMSGCDGIFEAALGLSVEGQQDSEVRRLQDLALIIEGLRPWQNQNYEGLDTTERLHFHFSLSCIGEGNGSPLQCSCLENPRDGGAWWAAVYRVTHSRIRLKRLSSSSSRGTGEEGRS